MNIQEKYLEKCRKRSDINELLPTLNEYANKCNHITEMGTRYFVSTYAFLNSNADVISYDIESQPSNFDECKILCAKENKNFTYIIEDVLKIEIEETDFLFIDTWHEYGQLKKELELHADKARKYIGFHDTTTYAHVGETQYWDVKASGGFSETDKGLWDAIEEFLKDNPQWIIDVKLEHNNGLTILKRL